MAWDNPQAAAAALSGYPLDPAGTGVGLDGRLLPAGVLTGLCLRWPRGLGDRAWVTGLSCGPVLCGATFSGPSGPLAAVALDRRTPGVVTAVRPLADGVSGWAVGGWGPAGGRWAAGPEGGLLAQKAARPYRPAGVTGVWADRTGVRLTGAVPVAAAGPLTATTETVSVGGVPTRALVVRMDPAAAGQPGAAAAAVFRGYAGPCGSAVGGCDGEPPVRSVGGARPDCDGVLTLVVEGVPVAAAPGGLVLAWPGSPGGHVPACPPRFFDSPAWLTMNNPPVWPDLPGWLPPFVTIGSADAPAWHDPLPSGPAPLAVRLAASASGGGLAGPSTVSTVQYSWRLGAGPELATGRVWEHTFETPGVYRVRVRATDPANGWEAWSADDPAFDIEVT